ncbi:hypothetical protein LJC06_02460 [Bacteroidales bacterium OttesenSCG-928-I14]|nr:hypothetical protein [Bacteroidales bacterium OttesenSCG-928-I14]
MAEIESTAIGAGRKSLGNITYRYVNGKTIASRRVTKNNSKTPLQIKQRYGFTATAKLAKVLRPLLQIGFDKNKIGSVYNNFMHYNKDLMLYAKNSPDIDINLPAISNLCIALNDYEFEGKVTAASGSINLTTVFDWGLNKSVDAMLYLSRDFVIGDQIVLVICYSYTLVGSYFESVRMVTKELNSEDIRLMKVKNQYHVIESTYPDLDIFDSLPLGYTDVELAVSILVIGEKDRSTSYFDTMPNMPPHFIVTSQTLDDNKHMRLVINDVDSLQELFDYNEPTGEISIPIKKGGQITRKFPIDGYAKDDQNTVVGLIITTDGTPMNFTIPFSGTEVGESAIIKDGIRLCTVEGVLSPTMGS